MPRLLPGLVNSRLQATSEYATFRALEADDGFLAEIAKPVRWRVHSVFRRTVNILSDHNMLLTIANCDSTAAPYTLVCSASGFDALGISAADDVEYAPKNVTIGNVLTLSLKNVFTTCSKVVTCAVDCQTLETSIELFRQRLVIHGRSGSFFLDKVTSSPFDQELKRRLYEGGQALQRAFISDDQDSMAEACGSLLGLGVGLTPSGDDYIVGFITALFVNKHTAVRAQALACIAAGIAPSATNAISAAAVLAASHERARQELSDVIYSALGRDSPGLLLSSRLSFESSFDALIEIGSTSGTDMAAGIVDALSVMRKLQEY